jgi:molybdopterin-guanine dinucleotide biosynthesis protein MobB
MFSSMHVVQFAGWSRSGKTTLIAALIRRLVARGERVAAIKHTHHPLVDENRGDTAKFLTAGATLAILAGDGEAIVFARDASHHIEYHSPDELPKHCGDVDLVLVEGFKQFDGWARLDVTADAESVLANLDRIRRP